MTDNAKTDYLEEALLNHILRAVAYTSPTTIYAGLFTAAPGETGGGTEVTGGSYARQAVAFDAPSDGVTQNTSGITFPTATAPWGTITHFALFDAATSGNMLYFGELTSSRDVPIGVALSIASGDLSVTEM